MPSLPQHPSPPSYFIMSFTVKVRGNEFRTNKNPHWSQSSDFEGEETHKQILRVHL